MSTFNAIHICFNMDNVISRLQKLTSMLERGHEYWNRNGMDYKH